MAARRGGGETRRQSRVVAKERAMSESKQIEAVMHRDPTADGHFVYGVATTGVYCRPSCPSRRPRPENLRLFGDGAAARAAGFRPCKRCTPDAAAPASPASDLAAKAAAAIARHVAAGADGPPKLDDIAGTVGVSPWHLQRSFKRATGLSPREYADALRLGRLKSALRQGQGVAAAVYDAGFGSASRVYERAGRQLGMTPATYAAGGKGAEISYALAASPLGRLLVAATARGVCMIAFGAADDALEAELRREFPEAGIRRDRTALGAVIEACVARMKGERKAAAIPLDVRATAFQWRVWRALSEIPMGETRTYGEIAAAIGQPRAARAVGHACGANPVALAIPCHRAVGADGKLTGYRWGTERKKALLSAERRTSLGRVAD